MPARRFYVPEALHLGGRVELAGAEHHHASRVMRLKVGDGVELVNGLGELADAAVLEVRRQETALCIRKVDRERPPSCRIVLAQGLPLPNRLATILEKGTELGASRFLLFPGERSQRRQLSASQLERARAVTIAAMKQCGRLYLPEIEVAPLLEAWLPPAGTVLFGDLTPEAPPLLQLFADKALPDTVTFFVGPESGFSPAELDQLRRLGAVGVRLLDAVLRTDTAPLVALSLLGHFRVCRRGQFPCGGRG